MNDAIVAILDKMHSALAHIPDVLPSMSGMRVQLGSIRADIDRLRDQLAPEAEAVAYLAEKKGADVAEEGISQAETDYQAVEEKVAEDVAAVTGKKSPAAAAAAAAKS